jgi:dienelactone hydrolase
MNIAWKLRQFAVMGLVQLFFHAFQAQALAAPIESESALQNECVVDTHDLRTVVTSLGNVPATLRIPPHVSMPPIVLWHGFGPPASELELMSRFPLDEVPAIKVYLGLPLFGKRAPAGGTDDLVRRQKKDVALLVFEPVVWGAVDDLPSVVRALERHGCMKPGDKIGLFGFSAGGTAALISLAEHKVKVSTAVVLSPSTGLSASVHAFERATGVPYAWTDASRKLARRSDIADRAADIATDPQPPALLTITGDEDKTITPEDLSRFKDSMTLRYATVGAADRFQYVVIEGLSHNPGGSSAGQELQQRVTAWFNRFQR